MFGKKAGANSGKELSELRGKVERLEKELEKVERLEQSLAHNEIILTKKIFEMNQFEENLKKLVPKADLDSLKKELKRFDEHEQALYENANFINELTKELGKIKDSHRLTRKQVMAKEHVKKDECEERFSSIKDSLNDLEKIRKTHKKKAGHDDLASLKNELHNRLGQVEHQNKVLMKYLKQVDELLQKKV